MEAIVRVVVHLACFALALYAMQALNYEKLIRKGRVVDVYKRQVSDRVSVSNE